jgi:Arc/MetJ-type ribon-helix-helix transcriptional regulator
MVKTQVQLPDELYGDLKRLAKSKEWSLAEAVRRGVELLLARHPLPVDRTAPWRPPVSATVGWRGLNPRELRDAALDDMEPRPTRDGPR